MRRQRLPAVVAVLLAATAVNAAAMYFHGRSQRAMRGRPIDREHFDRIKPGMTQAEVEAILGGPPGDFRTHDTFRMCVDLSRWRDDGRQVEREEDWVGDQGEVLVG